MMILKGRAARATATAAMLAVFGAPVMADELFYVSGAVGTAVENFPALVKPWEEATGHTVTLVPMPASTTDQFGQYRHDRPAPAPGRPGIRRIGDAVQPVLGQRLFRGRRTGAQDTQVGIQLLAVGIDDHRPGPRRQLQRAPRLARGGRAGQQGDQGCGQERARIFDRTGRGVRR